MKNSFLLQAFSFFALLVFSSTGCALSETIRVEPKGEFAEVDTDKAMAAIQAIQRSQNKVVVQVQKDPGSFQPPVLYALAGELYRRGQKDDAMYWFYLGQLRARSDANKALDPSAASGVDMMNEAYGDPINRHAFQDIEKLKKTVERVLADDAKLPRNYDPRWISLHGLDAFHEEKVRFVPPSQWASIDRQTRRDYEAGFREALKNIE